MGTFFSILPTPGISIAIGSAMVLIFPKMNKIALASSFVIWNPAVTIPINVAALELGQLIIGDILHLESYENEFLKWLKVSLEVVTGSLIISLVLSCISYFSLKFAIIRYQRRKNRKQAINPNPDSHASNSHASNSRALEPKKDTGLTKEAKKQSS